MHDRILTHGSLAPSPGFVELRAGRLSVMYEAGFLRYIRNGSDEVVRLVNHYLRDHNWSTIPMRIQDERVEASDESFSIFYKATIKHEDIDFSWQCTIEGLPDETIMFTIAGEAHSDFLTNRLGFTVLLPTEPLRGQSCRITHPDNLTEELYFPDKISPHQPFLGIQSMAWAPSTGMQVVVTFEGDVFEMEDQRNWMDATHKVYCTPLSLGYPHKVVKGDQIVQSVHLKVFGDLHDASTAEEVTSFAIDELHGQKFPTLGIPVSEVSVTAKLVARIAGLGLDFVSVSIRDINDVKDRIAKALQFRLPLEIMLFPASATPEQWMEVLKAYRVNIIRIVLLVEGKKTADQSLIDAFVPGLRKHFPKAAIGSGTDAFFTELNRGRTPPQLLDFLSFSVNPQAHASDLRTMTENLVAHSDVVVSCRDLSHGRAVRVGPVTLKMRWNPDATSRSPVLPGSLPANVDERQPSLYAAGWLLGSIKYLTESEADVVTFFEMAGWRGLMAHPEEPWPMSFSIGEQQAYPAYLMLRLVLAYRHGTIVKFTSTNTLKLDGVAFSEGRELTVIMANYTPDPLQVDIPAGLSASELLIAGSDNILKLVDQSPDQLIFDAFEGEQLMLPPYGFAVVKATAAGNR